jgi:uncharacterized protein
LQGLRGVDDLLRDTVRGSLMETYVILEIMKTLSHQGERVHAYYWRTAGGAEVDLVLNYGTELIPIEIKSGRTVRQDWAKHIRSFMRDYPDAKRGYVVHDGSDTMSLGDNITAIPVGLL